MKNINKILIILTSLLLLKCTIYRIDQIQKYEKNKNEVKLIKILKKSKDNYIKTQTIQSLGRLKSKKSFSYIANLLKSEIWSIRFYSARTLGKIGNIQAISYLEEHFKKEVDINVKNEIKKSIINLKKIIKEQNN